MYEDTSEETVICEKCGKRCYSRKDAGEIVNKGGRTRHGGHFTKSHRKTPVRYYFCNYCKSYHLTSHKGGGKNDY